MPIYAYKCESCGHSKDVLQKMSDAPLTECPNCHAQAFKKQVTAAGFQLKGSGWYATDFRNGNSGAKPAEEGKGSGDAEGKAANESQDSKPADASASKPAEAGSVAAGKSESSSPAPAASPATPAPSGS